MKKFACSISLIMGLVFVAVPSVRAEPEETPAVMNLIAVEDEISAVKTFCVNQAHRGYWRLIDESLAEIIYFCDGRYEGIWVYMAHAVLLAGSDLNENSFRNTDEILLVSSGSVGVKYIVDTENIVFLGIGYAVKRPTYLMQRQNDDFLEYLVLLPEKIVYGLDFSRRK